MEKEEIDKAYKPANTITLNNFTSKLKASSSANLPRLIQQQQTVAASRLRSRLAQAASRRSTAVAPT